MRLVAIVAAGLAALAFWRRKDVASGAKKASESAGELAASAKAKIGQSSDEAEADIDAAADALDSAAGDIEFATEQAVDETEGSETDTGRPAV